jgi:hypothetical protein
MTEPTDPTEERAERIAGFRALADLLEQNPELPLPYEGGAGGGQPLTWHFLRSDEAKARADMAAAAQVLRGRMDKHADEDYFRLTGNLRGVHFQLVAFRNAVCERVVVGTEPVTRMVPDPAVVVPLVEVVEQVEQVEWRCGSVLDGAVSDVDGAR